MNSAINWKSPNTVPGKLKMWMIYFIMLLFPQKEQKVLVLIPDVMSLVKIILVMPAINASSKCAFSPLRMVNSYLCTAMSNNCLNHDMHTLF